MSLLSVSKCALTCYLRFLSFLFSSIGFPALETLSFIKALLSAFQFLEAAKIFLRRLPIISKEKRE